MTDEPQVRLTMPARPEGVGVVRQALAGVADALDIDAAILADMKMAVTEAATNVVVHAYDEAQEGVLDVEVHAGEDGLTIVVRDHGTGLHPSSPRRDTPALGLGLPLIAALSDAFELRTEGRGTEVRMRFGYVRDRDPAEDNPIMGAPGEDGRWDPEADPDPEAPPAA
jgi:anti-sigma regulatory factor (Ser/Thr protein kinase)